MATSIIKIGRHALAMSAADARTFMALMERAVQVRAETDRDFNKREGFQSYLYYHRLALNETDDIQYSIHAGEIEDGPRVEFAQKPVEWKPVSSEPVNPADLVWGTDHVPV